MVHVLLAAFGKVLDIVRDVARLEQGWVCRSRVRGEVSDGRDRRRVAVVVLGEELVREGLLDAAEEVRDRLLGRRAVLDGNGSLEDTDALRVLVEDGLDILSLPKRVLREEGMSAVAPRKHSAEIEKHTFLNQRLKAASSTGMNGTGCTEGNRQRGGKRRKQRREENTPSVLGAE